MLGQSPDRGHSPNSMARVDGGAKPRLTSGGEAAQLSEDSFCAKLVRPRLVQPSGHPSLGLLMAEDSAFFNGFLAASDAFKQFHPTLQALKGLNIDEVR